MADDIVEDDIMRALCCSTGCVREDDCWFRASPGLRARTSQCKAIMVLIDRQREEIVRLHRCVEHAAKDIEVLGLGFRDAALRVRAALSDTREKK